MPDAAEPPPVEPALRPTLTPEQLACVETYAEPCDFAAGDVLFDSGERDSPLFVLQRGTVDILDRRLDGDVRIGAVEAGTFIGDLSMFTGQPTVAACVATSAGRALVVSPDKLRELVARHSDIGDLLLNTLTARRAWLEEHGFGQASLVGPASSQETYRLRDFLTRNQLPFRWIDPDAEEGSRALLSKLGVSPGDVPVLVCGSTAHVSRRPTVEEVADHVGLRPAPDGVYDLAVVGAGPAGLAAAVYGASEGLRTYVVDANSPGGQAGTSSKIENYLGFLTGISGAELTKQATLQARKFGATLSNPRRAAKLRADGAERVLELAGGGEVRARAVLIATGADYRRLPCDNCGDYEGRGVYYAASQVEAATCAGRDVVVVGGGNSAGQAVVFLSGRARKVLFVIRHDTVTDTNMSQYLSQRVESIANVEIVPNAEVAELHGSGGGLDAVTLTTPDGLRRAEVCSVFVLIGATPCTKWLDGAVLTDDGGFILTGDELRHDPRYTDVWPLKRDPYLLETCVPGVFAAGDARHGSVKRVAAAVGEGSMAVTFAHRRVAEVAEK